MKIFVSYSSQEVDRARTIAAQLRQEDFIVMRDQDFLAGGQIFNVRLEQVLRGSDLVLLLLTQSSRNSHWVNEEIVGALEMGKPIIPLKLEADVKAPFGLQTVQYIEMYNDNLWTLNYPRLLETLRRVYEETQKEPPPPPPATSTRPIETIEAGINPFVYGSAVKGDLFVGREKALQSVKQRIAGGALQSLSIVANRRMGKSSLLQYLYKEHQRFLPQKYEWVFIYLDMMSAKAKTPEAIMRTLRQQLQKQLPQDYHDDIWPESQDGNLMSLEETMENLNSQNVAPVLLLDEWEEVQARPELNLLVGSFRSLGNSSVMAMVTSTSHELVNLFSVAKDFIKRAGGNPADTSPFHNIFRTAYLGALPEAEWQNLVQKAFERSGRDLRNSDLRLIGELAGGQPYFTQLAGSIVWNSMDEGWNESEIRSEFSREANAIFIDLWHKQTVENQPQVLKHLLGIEKIENLSEEAIQQTIEQLKLRGVVNEKNEIFSKPFADFIHKLPKH